MPSENTQHEDATQEAPNLASLDLKNGELVIYDPDNHRAWLQSDATVKLGAHA